MFDLETEDSGVVAEIGTIALHKRPSKTSSTLLTSLVVPEGHKNVVVGMTLCVLVDSAALVQQYVDGKETATELNETTGILDSIIVAWSIA